MALRSDRRLKQADKVFLGRRSLSLFLSLFAPNTQALKSSYSLSACVWLGVAAAVWGLSTFLCVFVHVHLSACGFERPGFKCLLACESAAQRVCARPFSFKLIVSEDCF